MNHYLSFHSTKFPSIGNVTYFKSTHCGNTHRLAKSKSVSNFNFIDPNITIKKSLLKSKTQKKLERLRVESLTKSQNGKVYSAKRILDNNPNINMHTDHDMSNPNDNKMPSLEFPKSSPNGSMQYTFRGKYRDNNHKISMNDWISQYMDEATRYQSLKIFTSIQLQQLQQLFVNKAKLQQNVQQFKSESECPRKRFSPRVSQAIFQHNAALSRNLRKNTNYDIRMNKFGKVVTEESLRASLCIDILKRVAKENTEYGDLMELCIKELSQLIFCRESNSVIQEENDNENNENDEHANSPNSVWFNQLHNLQVDKLSVLRTYHEKYLGIKKSVNQSNKDMRALSVFTRWNHRVSSVYKLYTPNPKSCFQQWAKFAKKKAFAKRVANRMFNNQNVRKQMFLEWKKVSTETKMAKLAHQHRISSGAKEKLEKHNKGLQSILESHEYTIKQLKAALRSVADFLYCEHCEECREITEWRAMEMVQKLKGTFESDPKFLQELNLTTHLQKAIKGQGGFDKTKLKELQIKLAQYNPTSSKSRKLSFVEHVS